MDKRKDEWLLSRKPSLAALLQNVGKGIQAVGTFASGTISGGIGAELAGGNFWDGARNGAISAGLNHVAHMATDNPSKAQIERIGETATAVGYGADGAELLMATHKGRAFYYTDIDGPLCP